jgi:amidohydrolase family protein
MSETCQGPDPQPRLPPRHTLAGTTDCNFHVLGPSLRYPSRPSAGLPPYRQLAPFAQSFVETLPDRLLWGSDWPHVVFKGRIPDPQG